MNGMHKILAGLAALMLTTSCGQPLFYAEIEEPELCKTVYDVEFIGAQPGVDLVKTFDIPLSDIVTLFNTDGGIDVQTSIQLIEMRFTAKDGITDFNSIDDATISVTQPPNSTLSELALLSYTKDPANLPGTALTIAGATDVELAPYVAAGNGTVTVEARMHGTLPANNWHADVRGCLHMKARTNYLKQYGL